MFLIAIYFDYVIEIGFFWVKAIALVFLIFEATEKLIGDYIWVT